MSIVTSRYRWPVAAEFYRSQHRAHLAEARERRLAGDRYWARFYFDAAVCDRLRLADAKSGNVTDPTTRKVWHPGDLIPD